MMGAMGKEIKGGGAIREFRESANPRRSLDWLAGQIARFDGDKPSTAKLSRIENGQPVPVEMLSSIEKITGISAERLRPDLARIFIKRPRG